VSHHLGSSPRTGEAARDPRNWTRTASALLVVLLVVIGGGLVLVTAAPSAAPSRLAAAATPAAGLTHGDLLVTSGETYVIQPTGGSPLYYQGGNITVQAGGTLIVRNVSLIFVEFVSDIGLPAQRLSHIYTFSDAGTVNIYNSTVTTDLNVLNAYAKLNVVVTGDMTVWNSTFAFPGWVSVTGTTALLTLNESTVEANPLVPLLNEPPILISDTEFAPSISVTGGAQLDAFASSIVDTYADATNIWGIPGPVPLNATDIPVGAAPVNVTDLQTPTDSINLTRDWLYGPAGVAGGYVELLYNDSNTLPTTSTVQIWYEDHLYTLGTADFVNNTTAGHLFVPFTAALTAGINGGGGLLAWLNNTGDFGLPSEIAFNLTGSTGPALTISEVGVVLLPPLEYNLVVSGAGSKVTTADSTLGLTFGGLPANPYSQAAPYPWNSNKLALLDGATAYLGNLTVTGAKSGVFSTSAVLTDATSTAYLYRWANFNITSANTHYNVSGAAATAFYAYNDDQAANATTAALNDLATSAPAMLGYIEYWDGAHGITAYGLSNVIGQAYLMLVSTEINESSLPSGNFLGDYHIAIRTPYISNATWTYFAVSAYPTGVALGSPGYGTPDRINVYVPVAPPVVDILTFTIPTGSISDNNQYFSNGSLFLNGPGTAVIYLYATPLGGGGQTLIGTDPSAGNGTFRFDWNFPLSLSSGTTYTLTATANYKTASATKDVGTISVPSTTSPVGFLFQQFLGLPLWMWIAIAAAAIVAILVVLMIFRRQAAGKLVECGECGELIPEDATVCPKCGAEFESDLVRCSRCSATIPANSQFCPECGAQLLGKPGEGAADPERQAYEDFTEKFRTEAKRELGDNYTESAFWDWWKRQPTYLSFSQWKVQQNKGVPRSGMSAPPVGSETAEPAAPPPRGGAPPYGGAGASMAAAPAAMAAPPAAAPAAGGTSLKPCPNCGKEIPPEYLVCPFCGAVTQ